MGSGCVINSINIEQTSPTETSGSFLTEPATLSLIAGTSVGALVLLLVRKRRVSGTRVDSVSTKVFPGATTTMTTTVATSGYRIVSDGAMLIPDVMESIGEVLKLTPKQIEVYSPYLLGIGVGTSISLIAKKKKPVAKKDDASSQVKNLLLSSKKELTRVEIAESLNMSIRRTRETVRKLLDSDDSIVEIKVGKRRKIKFNPE